ncbi:hypothetical protein FOL47_005317 [Perkinsus chesapeaki]|uniref:Uncharacterized protein n=1 Tax=Perkinsus chesapeaki TaxID=330153 RepID=A0A7J6LXQ7_PERCH|nr:hypothetical protein FOL47_005317 [Perkinsus chesapeaki]
MVWHVTICKETRDARFGLKFAECTIAKNQVLIVTEDPIINLPADRANSDLSADRCIRRGCFILASNYIRNDNRKATLVWMRDRTVVAEVTSLNDIDKPSWLTNATLKRDMPHDLYVELFVDPDDTPLKSDTESLKSADLTPATACSRTATNSSDYYFNLDSDDEEGCAGLIQEKRQSLLRTLKRRCLTTEFGRLLSRRMKPANDASLRSFITGHKMTKGNCEEDRLLVSDGPSRALLEERRSYGEERLEEVEVSLLGGGGQCCNTARKYTRGASLWGRIRRRCGRVLNKRHYRHN